MSIGKAAFRKIFLGNSNILTLKSGEGLMTSIRLPARKISSDVLQKSYCSTPVEIILLPLMQSSCMPHSNRKGRFVSEDRSVSSYRIIDVSEGKEEIMIVLCLCRQM